MTRRIDPPLGLEELLSLDGAEFVREAYRHALQRDPDPGGFVAYYKRVKGGAPKRQIVDELRSSPEGLRLVAGDSASPATGPTLERLLSLRGEQFVKSAYLVMLGREVDPHGLEYYGTRLAGGVTSLQMLREIAASPEYAHRAQPLAGLPAALAAKVSLPRRVARRLRSSLPRLRGARPAAASNGPGSTIDTATLDAAVSSLYGAAPTSETGAEAARIPSPDHPARHASCQEAAPITYARSVIAPRMKLLTLPGLARRDKDQ